MFGRSTTIRAGEESVSTLGVTAPLAVISMLMPLSPGTTATFCNAARVAVGSVPGVCAPAASTMASSAIIVPSVCFRISRLPAFICSVL